MRLVGFLGLLVGLTPVLGACGAECPDDAVRVGQACLSADGGADAGDAALDARSACGPCGGSTPVCDPTTEACVQCLINADCRDPNSPACDPGLNRCAACLSQTDCNHLPDTPACRLSSGACVPCLENAQCGTDAPICSSGFSCGPCASSDDCSRFSDAPLCDTASGACQECLLDEDCPSRAPVCGADGRCAGCSASSDCDRFDAGIAPRPVCDTGDGRCVGCVDASVCTSARPFCTAKQFCGECLNNTHCPADKAVCDSSPLGGGTCLGCATNQDCSAHPGTTCNQDVSRCVP